MAIRDPSPGPSTCTVGTWSTGPSPCSYPLVLYIFLKSLVPSTAYFQHPVPRTAIPISPLLSFKLLGNMSLGSHTG